MAYGATKYDVWNAIFSGAEKAGGLFGMKQKAKEEEENFATSLALDFVTKMGTIEDPAQAATMKDLYSGIFKMKYKKDLDWGSVYGDTSAEGKPSSIAGFAIKKMSIPQITAMVEGAMGGYATEEEKALAIQRISSAGNAAASKAVFDAMVLGGKESIRAAENAQKRADKLAEKENKKTEAVEWSSAAQNSYNSIRTKEDPTLRSKLGYQFGLGRLANYDKVKGTQKSKIFVQLFKALESGAIKLPIDDPEGSKAIIREEAGKRGLADISEPDIQVIIDTAIDAYPAMQENIKKKNKVPFFKKVSSLFSADAAYAKEGDIPKQQQQYRIGQIITAPNGKKGKVAAIVNGKPQIIPL